MRLNKGVSGEGGWEKSRRQVSERGGNKRW